MLVGPAPAPAQVTDRRVYVIGDSIVLGARTQLAARLPRWTVTVDAAESRSLLGSIDILRRHRADFGSVVVVGLGANDGDGPVEFERRVDLAMDALDGVPKVLWLDQRETSAERTEMNAVLEDAETRYDQLEVLDWNGVAARPGVVTADGLHLTPAGANALAELVGSRVEAYERSTVTTSTTTTSTTASTTPATGAGRSAGPPSDGGGGTALVVVPAVAGAAVVLGVVAVLVGRSGRRRRAA